MEPGCDVDMLDLRNVITLTKELEKLDFEVRLLKEQRDQLNAEAQNWANQRDLLNHKNKEIWNEFKTYKDKRDQTNETIKQIKERRLSLITQINAKHNEEITLKEKVNQFPRESSQQASITKSRIDKLEWEIQTTPSSMIKEKEFVSQIKQLEKQLLISREKDTLRKKIIEIRTELNDLTIQKNEAQNQLAILIKNSSMYHEKMLNALEKVKPLKKEADDAHRKHLESRKTANDVHNKYLETIEQIKQ